MKPIIMALDQGTSSSRTLLIDEHGQVMASASEAFECKYPQSGWVEQDPEDIWRTQYATMQAALKQAGLTMEEVTAIGITNQRETIIAWNRETGEAVAPAIVWQCRRTADYCEGLKQEGWETKVREKTGLVMDPYFSATKMRWILKNREEAQALADQQKLCFGTVDSWLVWKLTGGKVHATDVSNASRTLAYNIFEHQWDTELLELFEIPQHTLPQVKPSSGLIGETSTELGSKSVPVMGVAGDQQASLFGQACFESGLAKNTYGTGCFLLMNTGEEAVLSEHGLLTTIAWQIGDQVTYALEGSVFIGGALIQWLRDGLELFEDAVASEQMAQSVEDAGGVYVIPAFVGLGAPHWDPYARGTIVGLTRDTNKNHIVRAALEAIAYQSHEVLQSMEKDTKAPLKELRIDGGASLNGFLCQFQSDLLQRPVRRPEVVETTVMGAAFLAGLAAGVWSSLEQIQSLHQQHHHFQPQRSAEAIQPLLEDWQHAIKRAKGWEVRGR